MFDFKSWYLLAPPLPWKDFNPTTWPNRWKLAPGLFTPTSPNQLSSTTITPSSPSDLPSPWNQDSSKPSLFQLPDKNSPESEPSQDGERSEEETQFSQSTSKSPMFHWWKTVTALPSGDLSESPHNPNVSDSEELDLATLVWFFKSKFKWLYT